MKVLTGNLFRLEIPLLKVINLKSLMKGTPRLRSQIWKSGYRLKNFKSKESISKRIREIKKIRTWICLMEREIILRIKYPFLNLPKGTHPKYLINLFPHWLPIDQIPSTLPYLLKVRPQLIFKWDWARGPHAHTPFMYQLQDQIRSQIVMN